MDIEALKRSPRPLRLSVKVVPKSGRNEIVEQQADGTLRIKVAAAPEKGKANRALCEFLAEKLGVAKSRIRIVTGETSALKRIRIED